MFRRVAWLVALFAVLGCGMAAGPATAQQLGLPQSAILTISSDRLFSDSEFGKRINREIDADGRVLAAENRRIEAELTEEEQSLTERRPSMDPAEFRALADAFDEKVQTIRTTQDAKVRALDQRLDEAQAQFLEAARPVLTELMRETGAVVILERASVFASASATDITDLAIARINAAIGDGSTPDESPEE